MPFENNQSVDRDPSRPSVNNATDYSISISIMAQKVIHFPITIMAAKSIEYQ